MPVTSLPERLAIADLSAAAEEADDFRLDPEFQQLNPPLSIAELAGLEQSLRTEGCLHDFIVWDEQPLLLDGYNRYPICQRLGIAFTIKRISLPNREAALAWIIAHQAGRRNLTDAGLRYLRGKRYLLEKRCQGGTGANQHTPAQSDQCEQSARSTAKRLGQEFQVGAASIRRDAHFAEAVDLLAEHGAAVKKRVLSPDARIGRLLTLKIAALPAVEREPIIQHLIQTGRLPRPEGKSKPLTVKQRAAAVAKGLEGRGRKHAVKVLIAAGGLLGVRLGEMPAE